MTWSKPREFLEEKLVEMSRAHVGVAKNIKNAVPENKYLSKYRLAIFIV